jgi:Cu/Ag efflux pump CusA
VGSVVADARRALAESIALPPGTYISFSGAASARAAAQTEILTRSGFAVVAIVFILGIALHDARNVLLVLANVPFALVGGALAALLGQHLLPGEAGLSLGSLVGFVTLFGITMRNSIMLISHFDHLVAVEGVVWGRDAALRGASERLLPILMTALVTSLGLLPLVLGSGSAGREVEGPMAVVIVGGLVSSTTLNLLILPTLALRFGRFEARAPGST